MIHSIVQNVDIVEVIRKITLRIPHTFSLCLTKVYIFKSLEHSVCVCGITLRQASASVCENHINSLTELMSISSQTPKITDIYAFKEHLKFTAAVLTVYQNGLGISPRVTVKLRVTPYTEVPALQVVIEQFI